MDQETGNVMTAIDPAPSPTKADQPSSPPLPSTSNPPATEGQETQVEQTPPNTVAAAIEAFNKERGKSDARVQTATSPPARRADGTFAPKGESTTDGQEPPAAESAATQARSYEGLNPEEVRIFKRMSNEAYQMLYPLYLEHKDLKPKYSEATENLKKLQGSSYYDHEEAYKLTKEYGQMSDALGRLDQEVQYWESQLASVEAGEKFQDLSFDPKTGQYTLSPPMDASPQAKAYLINQITKGHTIRAQIQAELGGLQQSFKANHQNYLSSLNATRDKILESIDAPTRKALEKAAEKKLELWPLGVRNRPEVRIAAELLVVNEGLVRMLQEKEGQLAGKRIVAKTAANAGPVNVGGGGPSGGNTVEAALNAFHKAGFHH